MLSLALETAAHFLGFRERRRSARFPSVAPAIVMVSGYTYPCMTVDLSSDGAQLVFEEAYSIAGFLELRIPSLRFKTHARVAWCDDGKMGVEFVK